MLGSKRQICLSGLLLSPLYCGHSGVGPESRLLNTTKRTWIPACAGMTNVTWSSGEKMSPYLGKSLIDYLI